MRVEYYEPKLHRLSLKLLKPPKHWLPTGESRHGARRTEPLEPNRRNFVQVSRLWQGVPLKARRYRPALLWSISTTPFRWNFWRRLGFTMRLCCRATALLCVMQIPSKINSSRLALRRMISLCTKSWLFMPPAIRCCVGVLIAVTVKTLVCRKRPMKPSFLAKRRFRYSMKLCN